MYLETPDTIVIAADNINDLVLQAIGHIKHNGVVIEDNPKPCQQAYDVQYVLTNPRNRVHTLRNPAAKKYLCRELLAYFKGSLNVDEGLSQASKYWKKLADKDNNIESNYGYYVFYEKLPGSQNMSQYDWCVYFLVKNWESRKAIININQTYHKKPGIVDYPCTVSIQFFIKNDTLCCTVMSRSTDVFTGLPYDMGFFSFLLELMYQDVKERLPEDKATRLKLGYVVMKTTFTQIYKKTRDKVLALYDENKDNTTLYKNEMPWITNGKETLNDMFNKTQNTPILQWITKHAEL